MSALPAPLSPDEAAVIAAVVDAAPPLTESTRARLAVLLRPTVATRGRAA